MDAAPTAEPTPSAEETVERRTGDAVAAPDTPDVPVRFSEKTRLNWAGKTCRFPCPGFDFSFIYMLF